MNTLVHEDIYVYTDPLTTVVEMKTGTSFEFTNNATENIIDPGIFELTVTSGSFTKVNFTVGEQQMNITVPLVVNDKLVLDFRNNIFKKNGSLIFTDNILSFEDDSYTIINLTLTGTGQSSVTYTFDTFIAQYDDLAFLESLSADESFEFKSRTNIKNQKQIKGDVAKTYSFSLSMLWNDEQSINFPDTFRLRLTDEDGNKLETLAGCRVTSIRKGSSSNGGDYTFEVSGSCEKIY
jgi:hypothetical protein